MNILSIHYSINMLFYVVSFYILSCLCIPLVSEVSGGVARATQATSTCLRHTAGRLVLHRAGRVDRAGMLRGA